MISLKTITLTFATTLFFFFVASVAADSAFAGWTCCTPSDSQGTASGDCGYVPSDSYCVNGCCSYETKNGDKPCAGGDKSGVCYTCQGGKVSNACNTSASSSALCKYATSTPKTLTLQVGQSYNLSVNTFNPGPYQIDSIKSVSSISSVAGASPNLRNVCCGWTYGYAASPWAVTVAGKAEGKTVVTSTFQSSQTPFTCAAVTQVTVSGVAPKWSCVNPGPSCLSNNSDTSVYKRGSLITCKMPAVTDPSVKSYGTVKYSMTCHMFGTNGVESKGLAVTQSSTTGTFKAWQVKAGVSKFLCEFKYCATNSAGYTVCSQAS